MNNKPQNASLRKNRERVRAALRGGADAPDRVGGEGGIKGSDRC